MECNICNIALTQQELEVLHLSPDEEHPEWHVLACKNHRYKCMPEETPWSWIIKCPICYKRTICKSCYHYEDNGDRVCSRCFKRR